MANRFTVIFTGSNDAAQADSAKLIIRKRPKNNPSADPMPEHEFVMTKVSSSPAMFTWQANLGPVPNGHKRLIRVVAKKGAVQVAVVDTASPDRHA